MDDSELRAWWAHRQALDGSSLGQSAATILATTGWARSVAGIGPYLTLFSSGTPPAAAIKKCPTTASWDHPTSGISRCPAYRPEAITSRTLRSDAWNAETTKSSSLSPCA